MVTKKLGISASERLSREDAVQTARASVAMEGFVLSAVEIELGASYVRGEITLQELLCAPIVLDRDVGN